MTWRLVGVWVLVFSLGGARGEMLDVVATTGMVGDLVRQVGGARVQVEVLMGPGVDPHLYKPTVSDTSRLMGADVVFYHGLRLEGRMGDLFERLAARGKRVHAVGEALPQEMLLGEEGQVDPHVWFDVGLWAKAVPVVVEALAAADAEGAGEYAARGREVARRLEELHAWCAEELLRVPEGSRVLVTSHDAFRYFGRAYGFQVVGLQGVSTVSEAGLSDVSGLVDFLKAQGVPAIFVETSVNPRAMQRVAEDAGVRLGGELFSDALGGPGEMREGDDTGTYEGMIRYNVRTIVRELGGR